MGVVGDMIKLSRAKIAFAIGGLAVAIPASAGVAAAAPFDAVVNTTCTYEQVIAALNAQQPALAQEFNASPFAQGALRSFLASGPVERQQTVNQLQGNPMAQQYFGPISSIAGSCNNY
ncbi:low molecular weight T-cell antigen TB8.4 [Mycolicibacterium mageritense DSM 44476 = CIP 104973]|uniref:Hemophore-related protein n=2 Tax=Mycolicibacterium mageritense TaxID=53462 RepID=A0AAI8U2D6_MYCME|nr:hypothetical protein hbim_07277 [Mycolicibacterium mageritense]CDO24019.1 low molecular weight T-cell antigen TB8.4 [Mycolicibacterium mageritense DSM 44476 = CIP 104973]